MKSVASVGMPENVRLAVDALLQPFGLSFDSLKEQQGSLGLKEFFTVAQAEEYSGLGRWSLIRAHKSGLLPVVKMSNTRTGKLLIKKSDLDKFISKKMRKTYIRTVNT